MTYKCPECSAREVEKIPLESDDGKRIQVDLQKNQKIHLPKLYSTPSFKEELKNVFIMYCKSCGLVEIVDLKRKESLVKTRLRKKQAGIKDLVGGLAIALAFLVTSVLLILYLDITNAIDFQSFKVTDLTPELLVILILGIAGVFVFFIVTSWIIIKITRQHFTLLEFTFKLHRIAFGDDELYFFEYSSEREPIGIKSTLRRSIYGAILVLGIGILVIENFLTIPDLKKYFWTASTITMFAVLIALPAIFIFLYISPWITREINLYYHDKHRVVKNVGEWLDAALQFFAGIDIILTFIILLDSTIEFGWFIFILCLVMIVFSWFLTFTSIFNVFYHAEMKNSFKEHLKAKFLLPIRQSRLAPQFYYCQNCGNLLDFIHEDTCGKCGERITKCMICGDVLATVRSEPGTTPEPQDKLTLLAKKMERKLNKLEADVVSELACPECGQMAHVDEFYSWVQMRGTCPACKKKISFSESVDS